MYKNIFICFFILVLVAACGSGQEAQAPLATNTPSPTLPPTLTSTPVPTSTATPTPTPIPMAGPVAEDYMTRIGKGWVNDLTFSPNGKILSVTTSIGVYLYQVDTMELISFLPSSAFVRTAAFIDDNTLVLGDSSGITTILDLTGTPKVLNTLHRDDSPIFLTVSEDNKIFIIESRTIGFPVNIVTWDGKDPEEINSPVNDHLYRATYSREKNLFALQNQTGSLMLVDATSMRLTSIICASCPVFALSPNGEMVAATTAWGDRAQIVLIDTASQKEIPNFKHNASGATWLAFSPDGKFLVSASATSLNLWNIETSELIKTIESASRMAVFSPDGQLLATISPDGNLAIRDAKNGNELFTIPGFVSIGRVIFQEENIASIYSMEGINSSDMAGGYSAGERDAIFFRSKSTGEIIRTFRITEDMTLSSVTFSPDGKIMATVWGERGQWDKKTIFLIDVSTGERLKNLKGNDPVAFSPDGSLLASGSQGNKLVIWDIVTGEPLPVSMGLVPEKINQPYKQSLFFSPDNSTIVIMSGIITFRDLTSGKQIKTFNNNSDFWLDFWGFDQGGTGYIGEFSPNGKYLAATSLIATNPNAGVRDDPLPKGTIVVWDISSEEQVFVLEGHSKPITALTYSHDGTLLATGAKDNTIILWDAQTGNLLKTLQGHSGAINSLSFSSDGKLLYSNALDGTMIIWDIEKILRQP